MKQIFLIVIFILSLNAGELHNAVYEGNSEKVKKCLASEHKVDEPNQAGLSALHVAIKLSDIAMADFLLSRGADINFQDFQGNTPLILAIKKKNLELTTFVVIRGADVNLANNDGITPLHQAAFSGNEHVVDFLLKAKADPNVKNNDGATPYDFAVAKKYINIAQMIKMNR